MKDEIGCSPDNPLPSLEWPKVRGPEPRFWWGIKPATGVLTKVYRTPPTAIETQAPAAD